MKSKEMKNPMLNELDDVLNNVSGGAYDPKFCPRCGNPLTVNNLCTVCNVLIPINPKENEGYGVLPIADE